MDDTPDTYASNPQDDIVNGRNVGQSEDIFHSVDPHFKESGLDINFERWRAMFNIVEHDLVAHEWEDEWGGYLSNRWREGVETYGEMFKGEPINHALEEIADLTFYTFAAREQLGWWRGLALKLIEQIMEDKTKGGLGILAAYGIKSLDDTPDDAMRWKLSVWFKDVGHPNYKGDHKATEADQLIAEQKAKEARDGAYRDIYGTPRNTLCEFHERKDGKPSYCWEQATWAGVWHSIARIYCNKHTDMLRAYKQQAWKSIQCFYCQLPAKWTDTHDKGRLYCECHKREMIDGRFAPVEEE